MTRFTNRNPAIRRTLPPSDPPHNVGIGHVDTNAIHDNVAGEIDAIAVKAAAVAADLVLIEDSAAALVKKKVLRSGLFPFKDSPVGATALGISAGAVNTATTVTAVGYLALSANTTGSATAAFGYQTMKANTTGSENSAFGYLALWTNTTGSENSAFGYSALRTNITGTRNCAFGWAALLSVTASANDAYGYSTLRSLTTGVSNSAFGYSALYSPGGVVANATTTGARQVALGRETGQASATQRNDIVAIGYRALIDANDTVAVGSGAQALHANAVALGKGIVTTAIAQVAIGATHIEMSEQTAPGVGAANTGRLYLVDNGAGKTQLMIQFNTGAAIQLAIQV